MTRQWTVTEATEQAAFLSDADGYDVAVLRVLPDELFETGSPLNGEEWQSMVDLVAAAPDLLGACRMMVRSCGCAQGEEDCIALMKSVIAKAEGKDRVTHDK